MGQDNDKSFSRPFGNTDKDEMQTQLYTYPFSKYVKLADGGAGCMPHFTGHEFDILAKDSKKSFMVPLIWKQKIKTHNKH